jgi:hypothetical protein
VKTPGVRFVHDTVRAVRLAPEIRPWWSRLFAPVPMATLAATTAAIALAVVSLVSAPQPAITEAVVLDSPQAVAIQDIAETETLIAAVDHLEDFSDHELISLIGF